MSDESVTQEFPEVSEKPAGTPSSRSGRAETTAAGRRRAAKRRRRIVVAGVAGALLISAGGAGAYAVSNSGPDYRIAQARSGSVSQTVSGTGTIAAISQDAASFQVAGTVATVDVAVGDEVTAGQTLATLDPTDLDEAVTTAQEALADAEETLADDLATQSGTSTSSSSNSSNSSMSGSAAAGSSGSTGSTGSMGSSGSTTTGTTGSSGATAPDTESSAQTTTPESTGSASGSQPGSTASLAKVTEAMAVVQTAQDGLIASYDTASAAIATSDANLKESDSECAAFLAATFPTSTADPAPAPDNTEAEGEEGATGGESEASSNHAAELAAIQQSLIACQASILGAQSGQGEVNTTQVDLMAKASTLNDAVAALKTATDEWQQEAISSQNGTGTTPSTGNSSGSSGSSTGSSASGSATSGTGSSSGTGTGSGSGTGAASGTGSTSGSGTGTGSTSGSGTGTGSTSGSGSGTGTAGTSDTVTAEQILADKADIAVAQSELAIAEQQRTAATLTSTITGTVVSVDAAVGDAVTSGQTVVTVDGPDGFQVTMTVPLSTVKVMAVGNGATLTTGSTEEQLTAKVALIGVTNMSTTSDPSFSIRLTLDATEAPVFDGASAAAIITVASSEGVVTIPTSAIHRSGTETTVQLLVDGVAQETPVTVGAVGTSATEISEGVTVGDMVVLADLAETATSDTSSTTSTTATPGAPSRGEGGPPGMSMQVRPGG